MKKRFAAGTSKVTTYFAFWPRLCDDGVRRLFCRLRVEKMFIGGRWITYSVRDAASVPRSLRG